MPQEVNAPRVAAENRMSPRTTMMRLRIEDLPLHETKEIVAALVRLRRDLRPHVMVPHRRRVMSKNAKSNCRRKERRCLTSMSLSRARESSRIDSLSI